MRVLLIEDDELLGDGISKALKQLNYSVDWLKDGESGRQALKVELFDIVVLDLGLPKLSGLNVLQWIRSIPLVVPVLILTAQDGIDMRVKGLDAGADDYLVKPFDLDELAARIRALIRRSHGRVEKHIVYEDLTIDVKAHTVTKNGTLIPLARREFALLEKLMENVGHVLSRDALIQSLYSWDNDVDSNTLEVYIHNLRKKLNATFIRTIRGVGYLVEKPKSLEP